MTRVLVVEDDVLIGMDLVMLIEGHGYDVDGPYRTPEAALRAVEAAPPELAVLDVNLGRGLTSVPIADDLRSRGVPYVLLTGYDPARFCDIEAIRDAPHLRKPVSDRALERALRDLQRGEARPLRAG